MLDDAVAAGLTLSIANVIIARCEKNSVEVSFQQGCSGSQLLPSNYGSAIQYIQYLRNHGMAIPLKHAGSLAITESVSKLPTCLPRAATWKRLNDRL